MASNWKADYARDAERAKRAARIERNRAQAHKGSNRNG